MSRSGSVLAPWPRLIEVGVGAVVLVSALLLFNRSAQNLESRGDEWLYLHSSRYFANLYSAGGPANAEWADGYWTHLQPMMLPYAIGAWLTAKGYDVYQMPAPRISTYGRTLYNLPPGQPSYELGRDNFLVGPVPDRALLADARALMAFIAAGVVLLVYLTGRAIAGPLAGVSAAALLLSRPLFSHELVWVQTESLLMLFILLALLLALLGARRGTRGGLPVRWAIPLGIALGLALGTKLTAVLSLVAVGTWLVAAAAAAAVRDSQGGRRTPALTGRLRLALLAARGWLVALGVALSVFVLSNPHLYSNPIGHAVHLFGTRAEAMEQAPSRSPDGGLTGYAERINYVVRGSLMGASSTGSQESLPQRALGVGMAGLAIIGLGAVSVKVVRANRGTPADAIVPITVLVYFAGVSAGMGLGLTRYIVPTGVLGAVLCGVGIAVVSGAVMSWAAHAPKVNRLVSKTWGRFQIRPHTIARS